jgi:hypothetical protein
MQVSIYRCFLPDLTGFIDLHCIGPRSSGIQSNQIFLVWFLSREFSPAIADCRYRAPLAPRLARPNLEKSKIKNKKSKMIQLIYFRIVEPFFVIVIILAASIFAISCVSFLRSSRSLKDVWNRPSVIYQR